MSAAKETVEDNINLLDELKKAGFVRYNKENPATFIVEKMNGTEEISVESYFLNPLENREEYVAVLNLSMLLMESVFNNDLDKVEKIIRTGILKFMHYDSCINGALSEESFEPDFKIINALYEQIPCEVREFTLFSFLSNSSRESVVDWCLSKIEEEEYLDFDNILKQMENVKLYKKIFEYALNKNLLESNADNFFMLAFDGKSGTIENGKLFLNNVSLEKIQSEVKCAAILSIAFAEPENKELMDLLLSNVSYPTEYTYTWLANLIVSKKTDMIKFILDKVQTKIKKEHIEFCLISLKNNMSVEILKTLKDLEDHMESPLDLKSGDNVLIREAIINDKKEIVEYLLNNNVYPSRSVIEENELLNDTIEFFASEEITEMINNYFENKN
jgi:hypothetical protein